MTRPGVLELVGRDQPRPDRGREVLALRRPEPDRRLVALQVARRPVVQDRVAADDLLASLRRTGSAPAYRRARRSRSRSRAPSEPAGAQTGSSGPRSSDDVREVEDSEAIPRLGDLAASAAPHHPDVLLEAVSIAKRRWREDRRTEPDRLRVEDRVVVLVACFESVDDVPECSDPKPASQRRRRGSRSAGGTGPIRARASASAGDRPTPGRLQVEPPTVVERRREPPWRAGRRVPLADVGEPHRWWPGPMAGSERLPLHQPDEQREARRRRPPSSPPAAASPWRRRAQRPSPA